MRSLLTFGLLGVMATPTHASDALSDMFASCTGRLSAQLEHAWLVGTPSEEIQAQRQAMVTLLEAVMTPDRGRQVLAIRIDAKHAQAALLTRATFNDDAEDAEWALRRAEVEVAHCASLLLS